MSETPKRTNSAVRMIGFAVFAFATWQCFTHDMTIGIVLFGAATVACVVAR